MCVHTVRTYVCELINSSSNQFCRQKSLCRDRPPIDVYIHTYAHVQGQRKLHSYLAGPELYQKQA